MKYCVTLNKKKNANVKSFQYEYEDNKGNSIIIYDASMLTIEVDGEYQAFVDYFRSIWELAFLYDGYFYDIAKYTVNDVETMVDELYFLAYYKTGKTWKNCATNLVGEYRDYSAKAIDEYKNFRNLNREKDKMITAIINSFFYLHSEAYENINSNHRLSLFMNMCDGFVINTKGENNNVKASFATLLNNMLNSKSVKYGTSLLGIQPNKIYDALQLERHEIDHYIKKDGSLSDYVYKLKTKSKDYIIWYFTYITELALRVAFLESIGCKYATELVEQAVDGINDWIILQCDMKEKCKLPNNQIIQELRERGISI